MSGGEQTTAENAGTDTSGWGYSLANLRELLFGCLDAIQAKSVLEVGSYKGELTSDLLAWAEGSGASIAGLDPEPPDELLELGKQRPELELVLKTSHDALAEIEFPDAIVIDGDHNYFTLREELRIIGERAPGAEIPLLMFHDVAWPHARRDTYYVPERIPEEHRQPLAARGLPVAHRAGRLRGRGPAVHLGRRAGGGPQKRDAHGDRGLRRRAARGCASSSCPRSSASAPSGTPARPGRTRWQRFWIRSTATPCVERLEANRVSQIVERSRDLVRARKVNDELTERSKAQGDRLREKEEEIRERAARLRELDARLRPQQAVLRRLLNSRALALYERAMRLRRREPVVSSDEIRQVLGEGDAGGATEPSDN